MNTVLQRPPPGGKQVLIVIGMHRSGTSATTGALQCLGIQLGERLYAGHSHINAKGYFEHSDIANTNEEALLSLGSAWDDMLLKDEAWWKRDELQPFSARIRRYVRRDFSRSDLWAIKDPRVCRLLPWWLELLAAEGVSPHFLFVVRSPDAVYRSLERRDGFSREKSFMLWLLHYLEAEQGSRGHPRSFMMFDHFLEDPISELSRVEGQLGLRFPVSVQAAAGCLKQFLSKDLRHHSDSGDVRRQETPIVDLAYELEARLQQAASAATSEEARINTEDLSRRLEVILRQFHPILVEQLRSVGRQRGQVELTIHRILASWSWYVGKPIRFFERLFGREV